MQAGAAEAQSAAAAAKAEAEGKNRSEMPYRGTLLTRNRTPLGPYSRTMPRALWWS